jgi:hypothetical protein
VDADGVVKDSPSDMERMATSYFQTMYTRDPSLNAEHVTNLFDACISEDMNEMLCKSFSEVEIADALFQIGL